MKLAEIKTEIQKYQYLEDTKLIDVTLATIIANRLKLGDPVWLIIIGASSGGKSQILRPIAQTDSKFIHRVDDLTENTFLSGVKSKKDDETSLLLRIGTHGIITISDFTVLMSKNGEARSTILSQFRMIYDGEMVKHSGNRKEAIKWAGYLGIIAGSTPSIYASFEEVSDMGERFIYYRMKEFDSAKATHLALSRGKYGKDLDTMLAGLYGEYIKEVIKSHDQKDVELSETTKQRIIEVASFAERVRTAAHTDWRGELINRIPVSAMPMRVALQLMAIAKALCIIKKHEDKTYELAEDELSTIDWLGYSLANEEKRACLKVLASVSYDVYVTTGIVADKIGLDTKVTRIILQNLASVGVLKRNGNESSLTWKIKEQADYNLVRRIEHIKVTEVVVERAMSFEEEDSEALDIAFNQEANDPREDD